MKPLQEIVEEHVDGDSINLADMMKAVVEEMGTPPQLDGRTAIAVIDVHVDFALNYIGGLVLTSIDDLGQLDEPLETAIEKLRQSLEWDKLRRLYTLKEQQTQQKIVIPGG